MFETRKRDEVGRAQVDVEDVNRVERFVHGQGLATMPLEKLSIERAIQGAKNNVLVVQAVRSLMG